MAFKYYNEKEIVFQPLGKRTKDITGKQFDKLTVLGFAGKDNNNRTFWWCKCSCPEHNITKVRVDQLNAGRARSCGCLIKEKAAENIKNITNHGSRKEELTGQIFGQLTVIEDSGKRQKMGNGTTIIWKCECSCGNITYVTAGHLKSGHTISCGCVKSKGERKIASLLRDNNITFIQQKTFDSCKFKNNYKARFDFYLSELNCLIEYDGEQHFDCQRHGWNNEDNFKKIQANDEYKNSWCKDNNILLIRIPYTHYNQLCINDLLPSTSNFKIN